MTLQASGSMTTAQIQAEIGDTGSIKIPDANTRTLTGKSTGALTIGTDFYGKTWSTGGGGVLVVSVTPTDPSTLGTGPTATKNFTATPTNNTAAVSFSWSVSPSDGAASINSGGTSSVCNVNVSADEGPSGDGTAMVNITCTITQGSNTASDTTTWSYTDTSFVPGSTTCVTWDTWLPGIGLAAYAKEGQEILIGDPKKGKTAIAKITKVSTHCDCCVRITTKMGVSLDCTTTAPIALAGGGRRRAPDLLGQQIPVKIDGVWEIDEVCSIVPIGMQTVVKITCEDNFFFAGREIDRYMLHHNIKA